jgi:hypothetical protein
MKSNKHEFYSASLNNQYYFKLLHLVGDLFELYDDARTYKI